MTNRCLEGIYAPTHQELTVTDLPVTGTIPDHLDGRYLRNGPNPLGDPDPATYHWYMGDGMVHGVRLRDGRAEWYRNRWIRTTDEERLDDRPQEMPRIHAASPACGTATAAPSAPPGPAS